MTERILSLALVAVFAPATLIGGEAGKPLDLRLYPGAAVGPKASKEQLRKEPPEIDALRIDPQDKNLEAPKPIDWVHPPFPTGLSIQDEFVVLDCLVTVKGAVDSCTLREGSADASIVFSTVAAVKQWTYKPAKLNGEVRPAYVTVVHRFAAGSTPGLRR